VFFLVKGIVGYVFNVPQEFGHSQGYFGAFVFNDEPGPADSVGVFWSVKQDIWKHVGSP
jgi:hypothetical protein